MMKLHEILRGCNKCLLVLRTRELFGYVCHGGLLPAFDCYKEVHNEKVCVFSASVFSRFRITTNKVSHGDMVFSQDAVNASLGCFYVHLLLGKGAQGDMVLLNVKLNIRNIGMVTPIFL